MRGILIAGAEAGADRGLEIVCEGFGEPDPHRLVDDEAWHA